MLLLDEELLPWAAVHLDLNWVQHRVARQIISMRLTVQPDGDRPSLTALLAAMEEAAARSLGLSGIRHATDQLHALTADPRNAVRVAAREALERLSHS